MGPFLWIMIINTPIFIILTIKGTTKGIARLFKLKEYNFRYLAVFLTFFAYTFTSIDAKILSIYRDHFNVKLFGILFEKGVMIDMGVKSSDIFGLIFQGIMVFGFLFAVLKFSNWGYKKEPIIAVKYPKLLWVKALKILIVISLAEKILFSYFHYTDKKATNAYWTSVPSYTPLRMSKIWTPLLNASTEEEREEANVVWDYENDFLSQFNLSKESLSAITSKKKDIDILFLVFESLRYDMADPDIMPNLYRYKNNWLATEHHFSSSNCTGNGTFGLMTGLTPFYWFPSYKNKLQPHSLSILDQLGYTFNVYTTTDLEYSAMDEHIFTDVIDHVYAFTGYGGGLGHPMVKRSDLYKWDELMVEQYIESLHIQNESPQFNYLWFYSTHYNYYFPESFGKFKPYIDRHYQIYEEGLQKETELVFNRYKNSAFYADHLISQIVEALSEKERLEKTIIVVVGDHGEEFNEFGRFAHSYSFKNVQSSTPFVMHLPGRQKTNYTVSSHADVLPTIFDYLDLSVPYELFTDGKSLLAYDPKRNFAIVQECQIKKRPKRFLIANESWKMEFRLSGESISSDLLESINDESISSESSPVFSHIKKELLGKVDSGLSHFSKK